MTPPDDAYSVALMVAGLICLTAGGFVLKMRRTALGSIPLAIFLFALSWWDLTYSFFWAGAPAPTPTSGYILHMGELLLSLPR
jgi:hypothetical protein